MPTMPSFNSNAYANHPIQIPPEFPKILKQYTKAAIRTQPKDLLLWSCAYFRCLANGDIPPVKERLEYPVPPSESGLTPGLLRVLNKQVSQGADATASGGLAESVPKPTLKSKWRGVCLAVHHLEEILHSAGLDNEDVPWLPFVVEAASTIAAQPTVDGVMEIVCEALAEYPEGSSSAMQKESFLEAFRATCKKYDVGQKLVSEAEDYFRSAADKQDGKLMPINLKSADCPALN